MATKRHGEIIWRLTYSIDVMRDDPVAEPALLVLADKEGWKSLAEEFIKMSRQKITKDMISLGDPAAHSHISAVYEPGINRRLSHPICVTLGFLTPQTRSRVLKKYEIRALPKSDRELPPLFRRLIKSSDKKIRQMKRIDQVVLKNPKITYDELRAMFGPKGTPISRPKNSR